MKVNYDVKTDTLTVIFRDVPVAESSTPERLLEINRADLDLWRKLIADAGIAVD